jgi:uncharacterized SAM-dependent methyltransferase
MNRGRLMDRIELFTSEEIEDRLKDCLHERYLPDPFLYIGEQGARNWIELDRSDDFSVATDLTDLLRRNLTVLERHLRSDANLVSIGVGDGRKERLLLQTMSGYGSPSYFAVDVSGPLVDTALETVADIDVKKIGVVAFLEDLPLLRKLWRSPALLCLLGNNFCNYEPDYLLNTVRGQMETDDLFLFDCQLIPSHLDDDDAGFDRIKRSYSSKPNARFNAGPLIERGMGPDSFRFQLDLVPVEMDAGTVYKTRKRNEVLKDTVIRCGRDDVRIAAGEVIRMGFTYKYTREQIERYLQQHGLEQVVKLLDDDGWNMLALVRKQVR